MAALQDPLGPHDLDPAAMNALTEAAVSLQEGDRMAKEYCDGEKAYAFYRRAWDGISRYGPAEDKRNLYASIIVTASYANEIDPLPEGAGDSVLNLVEKRGSGDVARLPIPRTPRRLRIAYISPDLNLNAVGLFVSPLVGMHDPARCDVTIYYTTKRNDPVTCWLRRQSAARPNVRWVSAYSMTDDAIVRHIDGQSLDVLVDLIGPGHGDRLKVVSRCRVPRIVNYLGFPERTYLSCYTHRIVDVLTDPEEAEAAAISSPCRGKGEVLVRLPTRCFVCYSHWEDVWPSPQRSPAASTRHVRLGVFGRPLKHHRATVAAWQRILEANPQLLLVVKEEMSEDARLKIRTLYSEFPAERLQVIASPDRHSAFMEDFNRVDFIIDTQPYSGTTITCAALYMGVPVVCLHSPALRHVSNVSGAIMLHTDREMPADLSLRSFVCPTFDDYLARIGSITRAEADLWLGARDAVANAFRRAMDAQKFIGEFEDALATIAQ
jgi:predicted O-linked N-acetylglucosamine transferase (SPINDLY family)